MISHNQAIDEHDERWGEVLASLYEASKNGHTLDLQEWKSRYPEFASKLEEFFAGQQELNWFFDEAAKASSASGAPAFPASPPDRKPNSFTARFLGDYLLLEEIGRGGMGTVFKAWQKLLSRFVAVKMIRDSEQVQPVDLLRFHREAKTAMNLDHPNIVRIYEWGDYEGRPYFSMRLIDGNNLARQLTRFRADPRATARLLAEVASALHYAHQRRIIHRDLKPANILLDADGRPYVSDFGLAKWVEETFGPTRSGEILGTLGYMSPEQASGQSDTITAATDVHGLGAVLYAILTGRPPFQGNSIAEVHRQVREGMPEPPRARNPLIDRDLEAICLKCLEKDPKHRYPTAEALAGDLRRFMGDPAGRKGPRQGCQAAREAPESKPDEEAESSPPTQPMAPGFAALEGKASAGAGRVPPSPKEALFYTVARDLALLANALDQGNNQPSSAEREQYDELALDMLHRAVAVGFRDAERLEQDPAFARLRGQYGHRLQRILVKSSVAFRRVTESNT
jgi:serine/threonine protein kinase